MQYAVENFADIYRHRLGMQTPNTGIFQQAIQKFFHVQGIVNDLLAQLPASTVEHAAVVLQEPAGIALERPQGSLQIVARRVGEVLHLLLQASPLSDIT